MGNEGSILATNGKGTDQMISSVSQRENYIIIEIEPLCIIKRLMKVY